jgi:hypothetical protein
MAVILGSSFAFGQNPTFEKRSYGPIGSAYHADFNNDGREDFVDGPLTSGTPGFRATMSTGDGTYGSAVAVAGPKAFRQFAVGDFNQDGNADVITTGGDNHLYTYYGHGDGTFSAPLDNVTSQNVGPLSAGDFNHDGRVDLAFLTRDNALHIYFANSGGGWTVGPTTAGVYCCQLLQTGDFDGDGKADLVAEVHDMGTGLQILFGDNTGHFTIVQPSQNAGIYYEPRDVNGDGITDMVGVIWVYTTHGDTNTQQMHVIYGNRTRTFSEQMYTFAKCLADDPPTVADFNGDGLPDVLLREQDNCIGSYPDHLVVATRNSDGSYNPEQEIDLANDTYMYGIEAVRSNRDTKPDIAVARFGTNNAVGTDILLNNTATGAFPGCAAPNAFRGINVCGPAAGATAASPVRFSIGAATMTPARKVEVWVDGVKKAEQLKQEFSRYAFFDGDIPLTAGSHNVSVFAAGVDNLLQKKSFTFTVGSGGGTCSAPSSATGTVICSPTSGSTVSSPVSVQAKGGSSVKNMEAWVDGVRKYAGTGNTVSLSLSLAVGSHKLTIFSKNGSTVLSSAVSNFTVK